jgi:hypothetical protein
VIVVGGIEIYGERSGKNTLNGRAKATDDAIAESSESFRTGAG